MKQNWLYVGNCLGAWLWVPEAVLCCYPSLFFCSYLKVSMVKFKNSYKPNCVKLNTYMFPHYLLPESNKTDRRCLIIAIINLQIT